MKANESPNIEYMRCWHDECLKWVCGIAGSTQFTAQQRKALRICSDDGADLFLYPFVCFFAMGPIEIVIELPADVSLPVTLKRAKSRPLYE